MELTVQGLTKTYGPQKAVENLSFHLKEGELLGFLGPNGAGKTTTLRMLSGFMAPTSGEITFDGVPIYDDLMKYKQQIGYLPEHNPLYEEMFVMDFLDFIGKIQGLDKAFLRKRVAEMVSYCGIEKEKHKKIYELSKGYKQRVGIAQALLHDPDLLVLDEPTSGLDPNQIIEIRSLIKELGKSKAILLSSHILSEVEASCERVIIINQGQIVADDHSSELKRKASGEKLYLSLENIGSDEQVTRKVGALQAVDDVDYNEEGWFVIYTSEGNDARREVFNLCQQEGWSVLELYRKESSLEDIFREVTR